MYIHVLSNHPPIILKELPKMIEKRISMLSSSKEIFDEEIGIYQKAIKEDGYNYEMSYQSENIDKTKTWERKIIWFNPPFSLNVKANIAAKFLGMIRKKFPKKHPLFSRKTFFCRRKKHPLLDC